MNTARLFPASTQGNGYEGRCYIGHPACRSWLAEALDQPWPRQPLTLVIPPLDEPGLALLQPLLRLLISQERGPETELALNDWGALYFCREFLDALALPWQMTAGLLLAEQHTDPLLPQFLRPADQRRSIWHQGQRAELAWVPPSPELQAHWQYPGVFAKVELLKQLGVSRLELCSQPLAWPQQGPGLPVTFYGQRALLSVSPCPGRDDPAARRCPGCLALPPQSQRGGQTLHADRNLLYYQLDTPAPAWADRLVAW